MQSHVKLLMVQETLTNLQETSGKKKKVDYRPFVAMCLPSVLNRANNTLMWNIQIILKQDECDPMHIWQ